MIIKTDLEQCRRDMEACIGRRVRLKTSGGRKRVIIHEGVLKNCYPNVFTVLCREGERNEEIVSFSYVDVLTATVEVAVESLP
ncbi:MAG: Veg family protein [Bacillota bacterium]|nr:Veg family protein [Bacillota bacterium]